MSGSISHGVLAEGIDIMFKNIESLLDSSFILLQNKKYLMSACLSIYAFEEMTKAETLIQYYKRQADLPRTEWRKLIAGSKAHIEKLREFLSKQPIHVVEIPKKDALYSENELVKRIAIERSKYSLDDLRELIVNFYYQLRMNVLYVDFEEDKWRWFPREYPEQLQKYLAQELCGMAKKSLSSLKEILNS